MEARIRSVAFTSAISWPYFSCPLVQGHLLFGLRAHACPLATHSLSSRENSIPMETETRREPCLAVLGPLLDSVRHATHFRTNVPGGFSPPHSVPAHSVSLQASILNPSRGWLLEAAWGLTPPVKKTSFSVENAQGSLCPGPCHSPDIVLLFPCHTSGQSKQLRGASSPVSSCDAVGMVSQEGPAFRPAHGGALEDAETRPGLSISPRAEPDLALWRNGAPPLCSPAMALIHLLHVRGLGTGINSCPL